MNEQAIQGQILADYIHLFTGLKKAIEMRDEEQDEDGEEQDEEEEEELNELEDEQDDIDSDAQDYANLLKEINDGDTDWEGETGLEGYHTAIDAEDTLEFDVFILFKKTLMSLEANSPQYYNSLTSNLTPDFKQELMKLMQEADNHVESNNNQ